MLFTRQNLEKAQFIEYNNITSVQESNYNATLDTKIIIHGFGSSCNRVWAREMRLSFLAVVKKKIHINLSFWTRKIRAWMRMTDFFAAIVCTFIRIPCGFHTSNYILGHLFYHTEAKHNFLSKN